MPKSKTKHYGSYSGVYGALGFLIAYVLVQLEVAPKSDVPMLVEALATVGSALGGCVHAYINDTE